MNRHNVLDLVGQQITARLGGHPFRVAIDGIDAAGKTTFADALADILRLQGYGVILASIDGFHNPSDIRSRRGKLSPEGYYEDSFNYPALKELLLGPLGPNGSLYYQSKLFNFHTDATVERD